MMFDGGIILVVVGFHLANGICMDAQFATRAAPVPAGLCHPGGYVEAGPWPDRPGKMVIHTQIA